MCEWNSNVDLVGTLKTLQTVHYNYAIFVTFKTDIILDMTKTNKVRVQENNNRPCSQSLFQQT